MSVLRPIVHAADALSALPLADEEDGFWVQADPGTEGYRHLGSLLAQRPDSVLSLDVHGMTDLGCLVHVPGLRRLVVTSLRLRSWEGIGHVADTLEDLGMGDTTLRPVSIAPLGALRRLRYLALSGPVRDADTIARLHGIEVLSLRSITLPNLAVLRPMRRLRSLWMGLGGTTDLAILPELSSLRSLELWRIRGMRDLRVLGSMSAVEEVTLQSMGGVTGLPSLRGAAKLRRLRLDAMKGIVDLAPVAEAPAIEELVLVAMRQLEPEALRPLVGHPTLARGIWGLGSTRKNAEAWEILPFGQVPYEYARWKAQQRRLEGSEDGGDV